VAQALISRLNSKAVGVIFGGSLDRVAGAVVAFDPISVVGLTQKWLARIIRGKAAIEVQPFRNEGKAVVP
jgi:hypothetical protein